MSNEDWPNPPFSTIFSLPSFVEPDLEASQILEFVHPSGYRILYYLDGAVIRILHRTLRLDTKLLDDIATTLFEAHPNVQTIRFDSALVATHVLRKSRFLSRIFLQSEDFVVHMPTDFETYEGQLSKSTRYRLKRLKQKIARNHPSSVEWLSMAGSELPPHLLSSIKRVWLQRLREKGVTPGKQQELIWQRILEHLGDGGRVFALIIDGDWAGVIVWLTLGQSASLHIAAHASDYAQYSPIRLLMELSAKDLLVCGIRELHLLWGDQGYKTEFLGKPHEIRSFFIYQKRFSWLTHLPGWALNLSMRKALLTKAAQRRIPKALRESLKARLREKASRTVGKQESEDGHASG